MARARLAILVTLLACGGAGSSASKPAGGGPPAVEAASTASREPNGASAPSALVPGTSTSVAPRVVVTAEVLESGGVDLVLQNHDAAPVRLAADVAVERVGSGVPVVLAANALSLRFSCDAPPVACLELVPGAELRPPAWLATSGRAQCNERGAERAPRGSYRFVARTCDGARLEGAPFELLTTP